MGKTNEQGDDFGCRASCAVDGERKVMSSLRQNGLVASVRSMVGTKGAGLRTPLTPWRHTFLDILSD